MSEPNGTPAATPPKSRWFILVLALWFGLATGFAEVLYHFGSRHLSMNWYRFMHEDFLWMTPTTDATVFLGAGLMLVAVSWVMPQRNLAPAAVLLFSALLFLKILLLYGRLHNLALLLLVLGLSLQTFRLARKRLINLRPVLTKSLAAMVLVVVTLAATTVGVRWFEEQQALAKLPAARPAAPNVLLITLDTVRAANLSLHGYARQTTPHLEKWAKKGAWFRHAITPAPWTLPAHASMFTGRYPQELSTSLFTPLDDTHTTLAELLRDNGYLTAGFVANKGFLSYETGLSRGFLFYQDFDYTAADFLSCSTLSRKFLCQEEVIECLCEFAPYGRNSAQEINQRFFDWLDDQPDRPFFAFLNYFDAHDPFLPPPPFDSKFGPPPSREDRAKFLRWWDGPPANYSPETVRAAEQSYDSAIAYMDEQLGRLLEELELRGTLNNTVVIITSDHGEHFGEHGLYMHGQSLYRHLVHVPLVVLYPKEIPAGKAVDEFVTLRDLPATVLDFVEVEQGQDLPGNSLAQHLTPPSQAGADKDSPIFQVSFHKADARVQPDRGRSPVAKGSLISLFHGNHYYIKNLNTGAEEIYDFARDEMEQSNLALLPEYQSMLDSFRTELEQVWKDYPSRWVDFP